VTCSTPLARSRITREARRRSITRKSARRGTRDAVQSNFCVIGEALSQLARQSPDVADRISEYQRIIGLRNQLVHGYGVINHEITWNIIESKLPILIAELEDLLK
jgi:uncharacterized protein with HEPN domain